MKTTQAEIQELISQGLTHSEIGKIFGVSRQRIQQITSEKYKAYLKVYQKSEKYKAYQKAYQRVYQRRYYDNKRKSPRTLGVGVCQLEHKTNP